MDRSQTVEINITGIVQGCGFRPFLYNLARDLEIKGYILNRGNAGVKLVLSGKKHKIEKFIIDLELLRPKISFIENLDIKELDNTLHFETLEIRKSEEGRGISLTLPPDIAICEDCIKDMRNESLPKYYQYPFIACAVCGPRYTTVTSLPYDRERSTMNQFPFCSKAEPESCKIEYSDFRNRRFHAQTFACSVCGPTYNLFDKSRNIIPFNTTEQLVKKSAELISDGSILAIKGIGGVHLVCLANNEKAVLKLRKRKGERKYKPFAVMVPNLELLNSNFYITQPELELLTSYRRPIVLLERKSNKIKINENVAPGLNNIGILLPYSGIHYLLFDYIGQNPLVYTSGNKSNIPMGIENSDIFNQLEGLADYFLLHNRPIYQRADDSVVRLHGDKNKLIRRSRGYVPEYFPLPFEVETPGAIATGPELAVTGAVLRRNRIFQTQHIGNVTHLETYEFLKNSIFHLKNLLQINDSEIKFVACDLHPAFITTKLGKELSSQFKVEIYPIQHHFAHILSLMAENNVQLDEKIIGITTDGVGYGDDGNIWGGEILLSSYYNYERLGQLEYQPMIGGDRCTKYPARMMASIVLNSMDIQEAISLLENLNISKDLEYTTSEFNAIVSQFSEGKDIPLTSSTGRIFDAVSYILGASNLKTYRGEPAMRLEGLASNGNHSKVRLEISSFKKNGIEQINTSKLILDILNLVLEKSKPADIAAKFQVELGRSLAQLAIKVANANNINKIGLSGGTAYNYSFSNTIKNEITKSGLNFLEHNIIAPGDAGISAGQLIGALLRYQY